VQRLRITNLRISEILQNGNYESTVDSSSLTASLQDEINKWSRQAAVRYIANLSFSLDDVTISIASKGIFLLKTKVEVKSCHNIVRSDWSNIFVLTLQTHANVNIRVGDV
jgi:hypothetical protein